MNKCAIFLGAILLGLASLTYAQAPVPFINLPLVPDATAPAGPEFTLTVNGTGFVSNSVVNWNGAPLPTRFVNQSQLTATVPAANIATASTGWVTVVNRKPGGGTSNTAYFTVTYDSENSVAFTLASSPATGSQPISVAVGDFNGDGKLDLAVANQGSDALSILLGDGTGNFTAAPSPPYGGKAVAVGDFNGDGNLDLAVAGCGSGVCILLGDGTGNFTLASSLPYDGQAVAVGDFNGDGKLDLAVAYDEGIYYDGTLYILLGDGTGKFTLASSPAVGINPWSVGVGDFNGDGKLDLAVANDGMSGVPSTVSVLLGDGTGNFTLTSSPVVGIWPDSVAVGDFNGDGKLDLAVAVCGLYCGQSQGTVSILLGDGAGNFTLAASPAVPAWSVALGDFNGDGILDLATGSGGQWVSVMLGDGTGNFTIAASPPTGYGAISLATGDFNGDGRLDLAVADFGSNTLSVLLGVPFTPVVTFSPPSLTFGTQLFETSSSPQPVTLTNTGQATLGISKITASANFSQTNNCPSNLAPNAQCTINITFTPRNVGTLTGKLAIYDDASNSPQTVPLTGVGTAVTLLPSSLNFGDQQVGATSQPQTVTLTNYAPKTVTISSAMLTGNNPGSFAVQSTTCGAKLPAMENCTANITFTPKSQGSKTATFEVNDNAGGSPQTVSLSGTGTD